MELIKKQKWENLFKRRELVFTDAVKEFYARMAVIHLKKKDIVKSSVKGVAVEFDHEKLASILGVPGKNGILVEEAAVEGESDSGEKFYDAEDKDQGSPEVHEETPAAAPQSSAQQKEQEASGVDPSCPTGRIPEAELLKFQAEFKRRRANRFHADLGKAKAENVRLLALLHHAQSKPHP
ncbi:hypothetical protein Dimus_024877 [Dionaea muscipula]